MGELKELLLAFPDLEEVGVAVVEVDQGLIFNL